MTSLAERKQSEHLRHGLECYCCVHFPRCMATWKIHTKITRSWAHKQFITAVHTQSSTWWRHQMETFPRYWPFVRGIHRSSVNSLHKDQWGGTLMFSLTCAPINGWVNNREAGDLRHHRAHYDVMVMIRCGRDNLFNVPVTVSAFSLCVVAEKQI